MRAASIERGTLPMPVVERGTIESIALFRSDRSGARPRYEALHRVLLERGEEPDDKLSALFGD